MSAGRALEFVLAERANIATARDAGHRLRLIGFGVDVPLESTRARISATPDGNGTRAC